MALDSNAVDVGISGTLSYGATTAAAPIDATTALPSADWKDVGYISDDGVTETRDRSTDTIVAWQNSDTVRTVVTDSSISVQFTGIETNQNMVELFYGSAVTTTDGSVEIVPSDSGGRRSFVLDYVDGNKTVRLYLPNAEVSEVGDLTVAAGEAVGYDVTIVGYPGSGGFSAKKWFSSLVVGP